MKKIQISGRIGLENPDPVHHCITVQMKLVTALMKLVTAPLHCITGHSSILLRSESPNGICAKLRTVVALATSKQQYCRVHPTRSLYDYLIARHIYGVVLRAHSVRGEPRISATPEGWLQQYFPFKDTVVSHHRRT